MSGHDSLKFKALEANTELVHLNDESAPYLQLKGKLQVSIRALNVATLISLV
jgi:hypothetical protein